jgi:tetratricopeptide (TPR) repeat protein
MAIRLLLLGAMLVAAPLSAQHDDHAGHGRLAEGAIFGHVSFPNSGNSAAQKPFLTGLALLHSFEYEQAADSFKAAQKADPRFALAYWMEALTSSKIIWGLEDTAAAHATLARLAPTSESRLERTRTQRERAFGAAVEAFYKVGNEQARVRSFADSLRHWVKAMPGDPEARAFAALAIIWEAFYLRGAGADSLNREAVGHAQFVFDRNPQHPGAAHYIIHASDAPAAAKRGLKAAREYSRIAPDAEHALHMPSHIFLPLGLWEDMVQSNERAWRASRAETARVELPASENDWHSLNWLQYAYLQLGRWKDARALIDTARKLTRSTNERISPAENPDGAFVVEQLAFRYGSETGDWTFFPADSVAINFRNGTVTPRARNMATVSVYQRGAIAAIRGDSLSAMNAASAVRPVRSAFADMIEITLLNAQGKHAAAIAALEKLRKTERVDRYSSMTPSPIINNDETLGALLVSMKRPREAVQIYQEALTDRPLRAASLAGLARAQAAAGDQEGARKTLAALSTMLKNADPEARRQFGVARN